jgi:hypothetical protein
VLIGATGLLLFPKHSWLFGVDLAVLFFLRFVELFLGLLVLAHLLVKDVEVSEVGLFKGTLLITELPLHPLLAGLFLWRHRCLCLNGSLAFSIPEILLQVSRWSETCWHRLLLRWLLFLLLRYLLGWRLRALSSRGTIFVQIYASLSWRGRLGVSRSSIARFHY